MNVLSKVTLSTMKKNRTRTVVTIIGVIISAAMFTAILSLCTSILFFMERSYIYKCGDYHFSALQTEGAFAEKLMADKRVASAGSLRYIGYAKSESQNESKPYVYVSAYDQAFIDSMPVHLTEGSLPANDTEILVPAHLAINGKVHYQIGDTLELALGDRTWAEGRFYQKTPYGEEEETFVPRETVRYTVCGFYERPDFESYYAPGYTLLTKQESTKEDTGVYDLYFHMKNPKKDMDAFISEYGLEQVDFNWNRLMFYGMSLYANFGSVIYGLAGIFIFLILLGSVSMIYSAFSISIGERTKQFGLLSSVGATKKQIRKMVRFEALTVSAAGIPAGVLVGIFGMGVTLHFVGDKFRHLMASPFRVSLHLSPVVLAIGAAIAFVTVMISVFIPAKRASSVSAIEAIRQNQDIAKKGRPVKTSRLVYKMFGLEGLLAKKYFKRARRKYRTTVVSLVMSVVLFISSSVFCMYLRESVQVGLYTANYDVGYMGLDTDTDIDGLVSTLAVQPGVQAVACSTMDQREASFDESTLDPSYKQYFEDVEGSGRELSQDAIFYYLDKQSYEALIRNNGLDEKTYLSTENPPAVLLNRSSFTAEYYIDGKLRRMSYDLKFMKDGVSELRVVKPAAPREGYYSMLHTEQTNAGRETVYYYIKNEERPVFDENNVVQNGIRVPAEYESVSLGDRIETAPLGIPNVSNRPVLIYPYSAWNSQELPIGQIYLKTSDYPVMMDSIKSALKQQGFSDSEGSFDDRIADDKENKDLITLINVLAYGFIILISLMAAANVFNTVSTNIALRRRDFAMIRSVGLTGRGLHRMMNYECILYGTRALFFGLPLSVLMSYLTYRVVRQGAYLIFRIPASAVVIAVCSVFAVVFATMLYAMQKIKKDNLMDALKNENL
ncbi:MAG: ABC transporter permease [Clostridiales bacterium]|nr:ABC transporter permease [Clostridiales bacterium]